MSKFGTHWGDQFGDIKNLRATRVPAILGGGARLAWDFASTPDAWYKVFQNKVEVSVTESNDSVIYPVLGEQSIFEVLAVGPANRFADYTHLVQDLPGNKAQLDWDASTSPDVASYNIYWDG